MIRLYNVSSLPIHNILHDDKTAYTLEGHGGKQVCHWPVYRFFKLYDSGKQDDATSSFFNWYIDQYNRYSKIDKSKGGMKDGSLDRLVKKTSVAGENGNSFENAVLKRIKQRFELLEAIRISGYIPDYTFPIIVIKINNDKFKLVSGHHRTAILAALGYDCVPDVHVFPNETMLIIFRILQKVKRLIGIHTRKA
jgi:hypothetical protein